MIKLVYCLRRRSDLDRTAFQTYWRETHGPLVAERAAALGVRRYVQGHTVDADGFHEAFRARNDGSPEPYDGVAELWFDDLDAIGGTDEAAIAAGATLLEDERNFIDLTRSPAFVVREHCLVSAPRPEAAPILGCSDVDAVIAVLEPIGFECPPDFRYGPPGGETVYATCHLDRIPLHLQIRRHDLYPDGREDHETDAYLYVDDVDAVRARCTDASVTVLRDLQDEDYGVRDFTIELPEGQRIAFGTPLD